MKITNTHVYFYGGNDIYNNWFDAEFVDKITGFKFENSEKAFMYYKANFFGDIEIAGKIIATPYPWEVKKLGRKIKKFDQKSWDCVKLGFMNYANYLKFSQNENLKKELLDTGSKTLVEASKADCVWGVGMYEDDPLILDEVNWLGQNLLGESLMIVRELLK